MKRVALIGLLAILLTGAPAVNADEHPDWTASGEILLPSPGSRAIGGVTELASPCMGSIDPDVPDGAAQGLDGYWIEIPEGAGGHAATLTADAPNEVDAWFYDLDCNLIRPPSSMSAGPKDEHAYSMAGSGDLPEGDKAGTIPAEAAFAAVDLYLGFNATFTFTILDFASAS